MQRYNDNALISSLFIPVQKLFRNHAYFADFVHSRSRSFKASMAVRPCTLCTYVLTPYRRTSIDPLNVRPYHPMSYDHENTMKMTEEKATVNINIHGGNNQILPNATHAEQHFHEVGKVENNYTTTIEIHLNATINLNGKISPQK